MFEKLLRVVVFLFLLLGFIYKVSFFEENVCLNIIFIMFDDYILQVWGIYGGILVDYVKNDNIKRLVEEGMILDNVFCINFICILSWVSIMIG